MKVPAALPGIVAIAVIATIGMMSIGYLNSDSSFYLVKDGDCYTYKNIIGWVNDDCYATQAEAEIAMRGFLEFKAKSEAHENRDWKPVE